MQEIPRFRCNPSTLYHSIYQIGPFPDTAWGRVVSQLDNWNVIAERSEEFCRYDDFSKSKKMLRSAQHDDCFNIEIIQENSK